ncbi:MAG TPA: hypothetical protein VLM85_24395 [Polyangiaceae bacterium]|nr:hypothetical protein [Polyangiaceae bacterium]
MWAPIVLAAAFSGTFLLSDRTEFRLRDPGTDPTQASLDLESAIDARMAMEWRRESLRLTYTPRFTLWDMNVSAIQGTVYNSGSLHAEWRPGLAHLTLDQTAGYGGVNLASVALVSAPGATPTAPPLINVVPVSRVLNFATSSTTLSARADLRRWTLGSTVSFQLSGGADADAQTYLPFQYGPVGELRADYAASHVAHLITVASAQHNSFSFGPETTVAGGEQRWHHEWSRYTLTQFSLGASAARERPGPAAASETNAYPVAEATVEHRRGFAQERFLFRATARVSPMVNPLLGTVDERLQGTLGCTWTHRRLTLAGALAAQQTLPPDATDAVQLFTAEALASYEAYPSLSFDGGVRGMVQNAAQPIAGGPPTEATFLQAIVFVGVTIRAPVARF